MNTNGMEIFLTIVSAGAVGLLLFVYVKRFFDLFKKLNQTQPAKDRKNFDGINMNPKNRRRRTESKPNVICSLPMHQESRREMRLY